MELSWSTFILEIINFLVLLWLLKHFLYRPVLDVIEQRRMSVSQTLTDAATMRDEALALRRQFEERLADWESEKRALRVELDRELGEERQRLLESAHREVENEREKARVAEQRRLDEQQRQLEQLGLEQGMRFASRLLERVADEHLHQRLLSLVVEELTVLEPEQIEQLQAMRDSHTEQVTISTAYPLDEPMQARLQQQLARIFGDTLVIEVRHEPALLGGVRIAAAPWVLHLNLADELKGFVETVHAPL